MSRAYESERVLKGTKESQWPFASALRLCRQAKRGPKSSTAFAQIAHRHLKCAATGSIGSCIEAQPSALPSGGCLSGTCPAAASCTCPRSWFHGPPRAECIEPQPAVAGLIAALLAALHAPPSFCNDKQAEFLPIHPSMSRNSAHRAVYEQKFCPSILPIGAVDQQKF